MTSRTYSTACSALPVGREAEVDVDTRLVGDDVASLPGHRDGLQPPGPQPSMSTRRGS